MQIKDKVNSSDTKVLITQSYSLITQDIIGFVSPMNTQLRNSCKVL